MGALLRRYWVPFLLSRELPDAGCSPMRVTLLNEQLAAYRDAQGSVGLLGAQCPHRGASLFFARNEECDQDPGLRCVNHGWKFDLDGRCVEAPNEPSDSALAETIRHLAYPCRERGGVVWTYMGPPERMPPLPEFEFLTVPPESRYVTRRIQECNWLQALEGGLDSSHIAFLHRGNYSDELGDIYYGDTTPKFFVVPADYGLLIAARRRTADSAFNWRNTPWIMPWYMLIPYPEGQVFGGHCWIPIDDHSCMTWTFSWRAERALSHAEVGLFDSGVHIHSRLMPGTCHPEANADNDYLIDRDVQRSRKSFTGIFGSGPQDAAVQESMGPIYDRTREHLGASDSAIIATRRHLLRALRDPGLILGLEPSSHHVRAVDMNLPSDADFVAETRDKMRAV
jgi:nitrite reductase/ring-hydroxylating ferredoxin subunit